MAVLKDVMRDRLAHPTCCPLGRGKLRAACCSHPPRWETGYTRTPHFPENNSLHIHTLKTLFLIQRSNIIKGKKSFAHLTGKECDVNATVARFTFLGHTAAPTSVKTVAPPEGTSLICNREPRQAIASYHFNTRAFFLNLIETHFFLKGTFEIRFTHG